MMTGGYIKLYRKMTEWEWYDDINTKIVFLHLLLTANYKDEKYRGKVIKAGQVLFRQTELAERLGLSVKQLRYSLERLKNSEQVVIKRAFNQSLVTIVNWHLYQLQGGENGERMANDVADEWRTNGEQIANVHLSKKKEKKLRNNNISARAHARDTHTRVSFSPPTVEEVKAYCIERGNNVDAARFVDFYASKGWMVGKNKMKDWRAAVRNWERDKASKSAKKEGRLDWIDRL